VLDVDAVAIEVVHAGETEIGEAIVIFAVFDVPVINFLA
jgi:hypothetical protein